MEYIAKIGVDVPQNDEAFRNILDKLSTLGITPSRMSVVFVFEALDDPAARQLFREKFDQLPNQFVTEKIVRSVRGNENILNRPSMTKELLNGVNE